jgi:hypothetical protein
MTTPAPPEEWHPFYEQHRGSVDFWLNSARKWQDYLVPITPRIRWEEDYARRLTVDVLRLTKHKAWAPAPYVGCPFGYLWPVAVDELGRQIAGRALLAYMQPLCKSFRRFGEECPEHYLLG